MDRIRTFFHKLIDKEGFYIILFICICIVATTAVWVSRNNVNKLNVIEDKENVDLVEEPNLDEGFEEFGLEETEEDSIIKVVETNKSTDNEETKDKEPNKDEKTKTETQSDKVEDSNEQVVETASTTSKQSKEKILKAMIVPLNGRISLDYAEDKLVYSKTLEQWTTHLGIDISAKEGSVVRAALDGVVSNIEKGTELGIVITLDHGGGIQTKYANLSTDNMVKVGQKVKKGDPISGVGRGTTIEMAQGPHLHFEVLIDGKNVNPRLYLPKFQ
jgi:murein DD-endopeptidase MepM/ murein hydrolase activator NlpD